MAIRWAIANGDNNQTSTWNDGATLGLPTSADDVFTNGFTVNMVANATYISMNNTAASGLVPSNQIPIMTSNTVPSGVASASTNSSQAYLAFDQNFSTFYITSGSATGQLTYQFAAGIVAKRYGVRSWGSSTNAPNSWTFQGSNDGISWTTLETVTGQNYGATGNYISPILANITSYTRYRLNITANNGAGTTTISDFEITDSTGTGVGGAAGGSFNFNTAGVTVTCTSTSASLSAGATNLITVTATTGTVTLNLGSSVTGLGTASTQIFNHTGACNFNLSGINFNGGGANSALCINKSSTGTITINGNLVGGLTTVFPHSLTSTAGNTIVNGNVLASGVAFGISQSAGNVTVTGNVTGGTGTSIHGISLTGAASQFTINGNVTGGSGGSAHGINFGGTLGTVNGNVTGGGGSGARGVEATVGGVNVNGNVIGNISLGLNIGASSTIVGNVFAGNAAGIATTTNNPLTVTVTGDVYASNVNNGITLTGTGTQVVNLTGNMYNTLGRMAIFCPNVFISNTATTLWRMDTGGGDYKFLYSADTTPNLPATTNVRFGTTYGPALSLTGTMVVLANSDVRKDVPNDNSVGTAELTSADIISGINASSDPLAVRLKNALTDVTAGNIISQYKDS